MKETPRRTASVFLDDGRGVVILGSLDAWLTQQNIDQGTEAAEVKTLEIVVYGVD